MASRADWQSTVGRGSYGAFSSDRAFDRSQEPPLGARFEQDERMEHNRSAFGPGSMDQHSLQSLLRRLVEKVEDSERRYDEALGELHARLDRLSHTTQTARRTAGPDEARTFDRLHQEVSSLARRLDEEPSSPTSAFRRLGENLEQRLQANFAGSPSSPFEPNEADNGAFDDPFPQSRFSRNRLAGDGQAPAAQLDAFTTGINGAGAATQEPPSALQEPDNGPERTGSHLAEMADRLERSIGAAMPSSTIEALNARLEEVGAQIAQSLTSVPSRSSLEHVEKQISEIGQQLHRAEEQLGRLGGVEERLLRLLSRLDERDEKPAATSIDAAQLQEIAARAAVEAARLVADDSKKTTDRLEAMQRELNAVSTTSQKADDKLAGKLQSVHESLRQLVHQMEQGNAPHQDSPAGAQSAQPARSSSSTRANRPAPAAPNSGTARARTAQTHTPKNSVPTAPQVAPENRNATNPQGTHSRTARTSAARPDATAATATSPRFPARDEPDSTARAAGRSAAQPRVERRSPDEAEQHVKKTLESRLAAGRAENVSHDRHGQSGQGRPKGPSAGHGTATEAKHRDEIFDLDESLLDIAPQELVEAARQAQQAAAARAQARRNPSAASSVTHDSGIDEQPGSRRRPLLIVSAAVLLVISAILLYGRLGSKTDEQLSSTPAPAKESLTPSATNTPSPPVTETPAATRQGTLVPAERVERSGSYTIIPNPYVSPDRELAPLNDRVGRISPGMSDIPKSSAPPAPKYEIDPHARFASLKPAGTKALPQDVIFSIEEPREAKIAAKAELLTNSPVKGPLPPEALGSQPLREAASKGIPAAQYTIAISYIEGDPAIRDPKKGAEWLERAARAGLAPAQYRLGMMYERGLGVPTKIENARSWYLAAAERGNVKAMHNLAVSVSGQTGSAPNYALAAKWFAAAAAHGFTDSQFNLGVFAELGLGQPKNLAKAYEWFCLAAQGGDRSAKSRRDLIRSQLSSEALAYAEAEIANWRPKPSSREANEVTGETIPSPDRAREATNKASVPAPQG